MEMLSKQQIGKKWSSNSGLKKRKHATAKKKTTTSIQQIREHECTKKLLSYSHATNLQRTKLKLRHEGNEGMCCTHHTGIIQLEAPIRNPLYAK